MSKEGKERTNCQMILKSHPRAEETVLQKDTCTQCSPQHYSQQSRHGSNLRIHQTALVAQRVECSGGTVGSIPALARSPGGGNDYPLQHLCLENPTDREAWRATVHGVTKSRTQLSDYHFPFFQVFITIKMDKEDAVRI